MGFTLITSHENADFDALASSIALQKLHPGAIVAFGRRVSPSVRRFLALHRRSFPVETCHHLELDDVRTLVLADVRRRTRLKHVEPILVRRESEKVEVEVWDHHAPASDDVPGDRVFVEALGAVTTLVVEQLQERGACLEATEATLFALGIHEDTGGFIYEQTTPRDVRAFAWLLEQGANLEAARRFLSPPMDPHERALLRSMTDGVEPLVPHVGVAVLPLPKKVQGAARVVEELLDLTPYAAVFAVLASPSKMQIIGRARRQLVNVGRVLESLGGGGHPGAGAAIVRGATPEEARQRLREALASVAPEKTVRDAMSEPVFTVHRKQPLSDIAAELQRRGFSGAPVVDDEGAMVGIVSDRDLRKAERDDAMGLPAAGRMKHPVVTIDASAPLSLALERMETRDVGRLPVLSKDGSLVGILTRTDALQVLYA